MFKSHDFQENLLEWYDKNARVLPWRAKPGVKPDPYHVWLSEIMLQQTTVPTVIPYFQKFLALWPDLASFARAEQDEVMKEWAGLGYYARARNLHKCAQAVLHHHAAKFPDNEKDLLSLPGIGAYTSAAISAIAFNKPAIVIDGNVERVAARIFAVIQPVKTAKALIKEKAALFYREAARPGDMAQALMDLGATICIPQNPRCGICPVRIFCEAYEQDLQNSIPAKSAKKEKPRRTGFVYWLEDKAGRVLIEKRNDNRMLGGMMALPTSGWDGKADSELPGQDSDWEFITDIYHSFTHFDLKLRLMRASVKIIGDADRQWVIKSDLLKAGLPTVFKKAAKVILSHEK